MKSFGISNPKKPCKDPDKMVCSNRNCLKSGRCQYSGSKKERKDNKR